MVDLPWREVDDGGAGGSSASRPLCLAVLDCDGVVVPHPPIARGIRIVIDALRKAGHKVSNVTHSRYI